MKLCVGSTELRVDQLVTVAWSHVVALGGVGTPDEVRAEMQRRGRDLSLELVTAELDELQATGRIPAGPQLTAVRA